MRKIALTILSGAISLLPVVIVLFLLGKVLEFVQSFTQPLGDKFGADTPLEHLAVDLMAILIMLILFFGIGLMTRTKAFDKKESKLESFLIRFIPGYTFVRGLTAQINGDEVSVPVVLVRQDDGANIGFEMERDPNGWVTVFIPGSPQPWSGGLININADRVITLDISYAKAIYMHQMMGKGISAHLPDVNAEIKRDGLVQGHPLPKSRS